MTVEKQAVLVTGLYGAGKSSLVAEIAERLERADVSFGAIDVDWLTWYHLDSRAGPTPDLKTQNVAYVADRYLAAGVRRLILAEAAETDHDVNALRRALPCPLSVVRLDVTLDAIEARLGADPTIGRAHDLEVARAWVERGLGEVSADLTLDGEAPLAQNASAALSWLGWLA